MKILVLIQLENVTLLKQQQTEEEKAAKQMIP